MFGKQFEGYRQAKVVLLTCLGINGYSEWHKGVNLDILLLGSGNKTNREVHVGCKNICCHF